MSHRTGVAVGGYSSRDCKAAFSPDLRLAIGQGGGKLGVGAETPIQYALGSRLGGSAFVMRTWGSPARTLGGVTYAGAEASLRVPLVARFGLGIARRVDGPPQAKAFVKTWSASADLSVPFGVVVLMISLGDGPLIGHIEV